MFANYHTHTVRCNHAVGTEREYVENAIRAGIKILGFSDHSPYYFPGDYYSNFRMKISEIEDYVKTITALRDEYKKDIKIYVGYEMEYYPDYFEKTLDLIHPYECDYLILGQHYIRNETVNVTAGTEKEEYLKEYVDLSCAALKTGKFSYMAHPDIFRFTGREDIYEKHMMRLFACAKELDIPLEINFLGIRDHRFYPSERYFRFVGKTGAKIVFGLDAHNPGSIFDQESYVFATECVEKFSLNKVEQVTLRNPFGQ